MTGMRLGTAIGVGLVVALAAAGRVEAQPRPRAPSVTGIWQWRMRDNRAYGRMFLIQDGAVVRGAFLESSGNAFAGDLEGALEGRRLVLRRHQPGRDPEIVLMIDPSGTRMWGELSAQRQFPAAAPGGWEVEAPPPPPPPPPPPALRPIDDGSFNQLLAAINRESFSDSRMSVVTQATTYHYFICDQVARILPLFAFEDMRLKALEQLRPRILDPQNGFKLSDQFTYASSRQRVQQIMMPPPPPR